MRSSTSSKANVCGKNIERAAFKAALFFQSTCRTALASRATFASCERSEPVFVTSCVTIRWFTVSSFEAMEAWARNLIPDLQVVSHHWSGQVLDTIDYAAFIGRNPGSKNVYVQTGDSGQGITHGVVGSLINSALILAKMQNGRKFMSHREKRLRQSAIF